MLQWLESRWQGIYGGEKWIAAPMKFRESLMVEPALGAYDPGRIQVLPEDCTVEIRTRVRQ